MLYGNLFLNGAVQNEAVFIGLITGCGMGVTQGGGGTGLPAATSGLRSAGHPPQRRGRRT